MNSLQLISAIIGLGTNIPLLIQILRGKKQNFAAFLLWGLLDLIAAVTLIYQNGNFLLPLGYVLGAFSIALALAIKRQVTWTWVETLTVVLVGICLSIWYSTGDKAGTIASSLAVVIAGIPQIVDTYKKPEETPTGIYCLYLLANILSFAAGKSWTIEERFYSGCVVFLTVIIVLFSIKKSKISISTYS